MCTGAKRNYERSLLEECTMAHMHSLKEPLLKPCLLETADAGPKVVAALRSQGFPSAESARTGRFARVQGRSIAIGDVVLYRGDDHDDLRVGQVYFHAICGGEMLTCLSHWPLKQAASQWRKVVVENESCTVVPSTWLLQPCIYTPAPLGKVATVLMPAEHHRP